jgi:hypothetical protein
MFVKAIVSVLLIISVTPIRIAYIQNVTLVPISYFNNSLIANDTCPNCLCRLFSSSYAALNCLSNNTCYFFKTVPPRYQLQQTPNALLYFPNQSLPEPSQCCMPNVSVLLGKLTNSTATYTIVPNPRSLLLDNENYFSTVSYQTDSFYRFNLSTLAEINFTYTFSSQPVCDALQDGVYYVGLSSNTIVILNSSSGAFLNSITSSSFDQPRDIIFLDGGQTMVVTSVNNNLLIFFNRTNTTSINYTFSYTQSVSYTQPHGLWRVNDTFFYTTSYSLKSVYSYSRVNSSYWNETLVINASATATSDHSNHVTIDECDRFWFTLGPAGALIYDKNGVYLGTYIPPMTSDCFEVLFLDNYVTYVSDFNAGRITRIDPNIVC